MPDAFTAARAFAHGLMPLNLSFSTDVEIPVVPVTTENYKEASGLHFVLSTHVLSAFPRSVVVAHTSFYRSKRRNWNNLESGDTVCIL